MNSNLLKRGFLTLTAAQFFGAANDNLLKIVLSFGVAAGGVWASSLGDGGIAYIGLCFTVPFILLSGYAGQLADRISKQRISYWVKVVEIGIALVALLGFWQGNLWIAMGAMVLLAIQSAFFGPAKYGLIPELVEKGDLSRANGMINMSTNIAVIAGTLAGGPVYDAYQGVKTGVPIPWIPGLVLVGVAIFGWVAISFMPRLKAMDPDLKFDWNPFGVYLVAIKQMSRGPLLTVACAWSSFYMIGMLALTILPEYRDLLEVDATKASLLLGVLGLSIGLGSVLAGLLSGHSIKPGLIPVGAIGMTVFFAALGFAPMKYGLVATFIAGAGVFAGFYIIPLQALLQSLSPDEERGRFLGTANAMSFVASTLGSLIYLFARRVFDLEPNRVFLICAALACFGTGTLIWRMRKMMAKENADPPRIR
jgi:acyl-[acyl-carrier-protein]-phospholipid O-acyltransferase/long-chain-fatty-acid--[acyl-carrier-protein] ligase